MAFLDAVLDGSRWYTAVDAARRFVRLGAARERGRAQRSSPRTNPERTPGQDHTVERSEAIDVEAAEPSDPTPAPRALPLEAKSLLAAVALAALEGAIVKGLHLLRS